jgi:hypothetical protein
MGLRSAVRIATQRNKSPRILQKVRLTQFDDDTAILGSD